MRAQGEQIAEEQALALLSGGEMTVLGLVPWSSNYTFLAALRGAGSEILAVYKPSSGERPLWDFDAGTLCQREVASYTLSRYLGWPSIPPVVLREGEYGRGSVQWWVDADPAAHYFTLRGEALYDGAFRRLALFDWLANNADRKAGHVLKGAEGSIWAIDHGLTFHAEYKLRTVIWEYAGEPLGEGERADLERLMSTLSHDGGPFLDALAELLSMVEMAALQRRLRHLLREGRYPSPRNGWRNVPYPLV